MERIGEEISQYGILAESAETGDRELPAFCTETAASLWIRGRAEQYADHAAVKKARIYGENGEVEFMVEYQEEIPFFSTVLGKPVETGDCKTAFMDRYTGKIKRRWILSESDDG